MYDSFSAVLWLSLAPSGIAGALRDLEKDATKNRQKEKEVESTEDGTYIGEDDCDGNEDCDWDAL